MVNKLWAWLIITAITSGFIQFFFKGSVAIDAMGAALFSGAKTAVEISLGLVAVLVLWLGLFEVAQAAGVVKVLARWLSPLLVRLMPDVPRDHPAFASIGMNVAMSMLGIDQGALPSGLKAMQALEELNPQPGVATRAQQMFMVYMTASVTIFPVSILGYRLQAGAAQPADVFLPLLLAGYVGLFAGLAYMAAVQGIRLFDKALVLGAVALVTLLSCMAWVVGQLPHGSVTPVVTSVGNALLLASVLLFVGLALKRGVAVYDVFLSGAAKGFGLAVDLIPYLVGMLVAISLLRASGAFGVLQSALLYLGNAASIDTRWLDVLPQGVMKAFSGGGARAMMLDTFKLQGPDSLVGHLSSIVQGASDTTFYILAACAGAAKLQNIGHALTGALVVSVVSFATAVVCGLALFG